MEEPDQTQLVYELYLDLPGGNVNKVINAITNKIKMLLKALRRIRFSQEKFAGSEVEEDLLVGFFFHHYR